MWVLVEKTYKTHIIEIEKEEDVVESQYGGNLSIVEKDGAKITIFGPISFYRISKDKPKVKRWKYGYK